MARGITDEDAPPQPARLRPRRWPRTGGDAAEVNDAWQEIKAAERSSGLEGHPTAPSPYDGIAPGLSALLTATKVLERRPEAAAGLPDGR